MTDKANNITVKNFFTVIHDFRQTKPSGTLKFIKMYNSEYKGKKFFTIFEDSCV